MQGWIWQWGLKPSYRQKLHEIRGEKKEKEVEKRGRMKKKGDWR
jgi:hypothetical protein